MSKVFQQLDRKLGQLLNAQLDRPLDCEKGQLDVGMWPGPTAEPCEHADFCLTVCPADKQDNGQYSSDCITFHVPTVQKTQ